MNVSLEYEIATDPKDFPYSLLLLADETVEAINKYAFSSEIYLAKIDGETAGVFCLMPIDQKTVELKNIAVAETFRDKKIGSAMIGFIKQKLAGKYRSVIVGVSDGPESPLAFYLKNGFCRFGVRENFFTENYPEPLFEKGVRLQHMILLKCDL